MRVNPATDAILTQNRLPSVGFDYNYRAKWPNRWILQPIELPQ
jgi:hypothetical protein